MNKTIIKEIEKKEKAEILDIEIKSFSKNLKKIDLIVYSSAIAEDNPEIIYGKKTGIPVIKRAEMLANLMTMKKSIAIAGSHGKTTTSGMLCWALDQVGFDFSYLVGGLFLGNELAPGRYSKDSWLVLEVDESDGTIDLFAPTITLALNCEWDHVDLYDSKDSIGETFRSLFNRTRSAIITPNKSELSDWAKLEKNQKKVINNFKKILRNN